MSCAISVELRGKGREIERDREREGWGVERKKEREENKSLRDCEKRKLLFIGRCQ